MARVGVRFFRSGRVRAILAGVAAGSVCACAASDPPRAAPAPARQGESAPVSTTGLEVMWWAVDDSTGAVGRGLASLAGSAPGIPEDKVAAWRAAGLRVFGVPFEKLAALHAAVPAVGPLERQSFGTPGSWTPVVVGRGWRGREEITVEPGERVELGPGRLRLLARCWAEPRVDAESEGAGAALRLEVLPQHEESAPARLMLPGEGRPDQVSRGQTFDRLLLSFVGAEGTAYVIVPEVPGAEWRPIEDASNDRPLGPPSALDAGPAALAALTLGEAMLTDAQGGGLARTRVIVVLVARAPERFELMR